jgi:hypothetical protein
MHYQIVIHNGGGQLGLMAYDDGYLGGPGYIPPTIKYGGDYFLGPLQAPGEINMANGGTCSCYNGTAFIDENGNCMCVNDPPAGTGGIKGGGAITPGTIRYGYPVKPIKAIPPTPNPLIPPAPVSAIPPTVKPTGDGLLDGDILGVPVKALAIGGAIVGGLYLLSANAGTPATKAKGVITI